VEILVSIETRVGRTIHLLHGDDSKHDRGGVDRKEDDIEDTFEVLAAKGQGLDDDEDKQSRAEELNSAKNCGGNIVENTAIIRRLSNHEPVMRLNSTYNCRFASVGEIEIRNNGAHLSR